MIDLDGALTADGVRLPDAWIGGVDECGVTSQS
jgi:hypothetical protein